MGTGRVSSGDADVHRRIARFRNIYATMSTNTNGYIKLMSNRKKPGRKGLQIDLALPARHSGE
jgi:hypothetical protein